MVSALSTSRVIVLPVRVLTKICILGEHEREEEEKKNEKITKRKRKEKREGETEQRNYYRNSFIG